MIKRVLFVLLPLVGSGYAVARQTGVLDIEGPWQPVVTAISRLPAGSHVGMAALAGAFVVLVVLVGVQLVVWLFRLASGGATSSTLFVFALVTVLMLSMFTGAAALFAGGGTSMWESDSGVTGAASKTFSGESVSVEGDTIGGGDLSGVGSSCAAPEGPDTDGDRLPDEWERSGEIPGGAPLPDADPQRKDIYIQPVYADGADRLTETEKRQLKRVWAEMPVQNPSGETGIALHFVDRMPNGGRVSDEITVRDDLRPVRAQYYNERTLGSGYCRYHLLAVGSVTDGSAIGKGEAPGYVTVVESDVPSGYNGSVSLRVFTVTHELLHNVVGRVGGGYHTDRGWLIPEFNPNNEYLSNRTARILEDGFAPPRQYWHGSGPLPGA